MGRVTGSSGGDEAPDPRDSDGFDPEPTLRGLRGRFDEPLFSSGYTVGVRDSEGQLWITIFRPFSTGLFNLKS
jgi:hypothetical protein